MFLGWLRWSGVVSVLLPWHLKSFRNPKTVQASHVSQMVHENQWITGRQNYCVVFLFFESQFMDQLCHYLRDYHEKTVDY